MGWFSNLLDKLFTDPFASQDNSTDEHIHFRGDYRSLPGLPFDFTLVNLLRDNKNGEVGLTGLNLCKAVASLLGNMGMNQSRYLPVSYDESAYYLAILYAIANKMELAELVELLDKMDQEGERQANTRYMVRIKPHYTRCPLYLHQYGYSSVASTADSRGYEIPLLALALENNTKYSNSKLMSDISSKLVMFRDAHEYINNLDSNI